MSLGKTIVKGLTNLATAEGLVGAVAVSAVVIPVTIWGTNVWIKKDIEKMVEQAKANSK